jgi:hypothetical protein
MKTLNWVLGLTAFAVATNASPADSVSLYDLLLKSKKCASSAISPNQLNCEYSAGKDFQLEIAGVGDSDAGISFVRSNREGDYWGSFAIKHGCVVVHAQPRRDSFAMPDLAFISPKTGKVYKDWRTCGRDTQSR